MSRRGLVGIAIVLAWLGGIGVLVTREYFRPRLEQMAEAALRVSPGAVYYGVMQGNRQIGFASSTIDTTTTSITVNDYLVADLPFGGKARRTSARTSVTLSRGLRIRSFELTLETEGAPVHASGRVESDSALILTIKAGSERAETQHITLTGPILVPTLVPLAVALGEPPKEGKRYVLPVFDPTTMTPKDVAVIVRAESSFVVNDSAVFDSASARWRGVLPAKIKAWKLETESGAGFNGWIDEQGRILDTRQLGLDLKRLPYEVAFENWRIAASHGAPVTDDRDIMETTAIAAKKKLDEHLGQLRVRLGNVDLSGYDLNGDRQRLVHDTLTVTREPDSALVAQYKDWTRDEVIPFTRAEPLIQSDAPEITRLAQRITRGTRDPRAKLERINAWVHDSLKKRVTFGVPSAIQVLRSRSGDCNDHTQLFIALARAVGVPTRFAAGLAYVDGKFYYHAWPEVLLTGWVAVDPTFGQFPADAGHLRFVIGGVTRQTELLRLMGNLKIDVVDVSTGMDRKSGPK
jgi:hypothetical protein